MEVRQIEWVGRVGPEHYAAEAIAQLYYELGRDFGDGPGLVRLFKCAPGMFEYARQIVADAILGSASDSESSHSHEQMWEAMSVAEFDCAKWIKEQILKPARAESDGKDKD